jgi:hypothetical protein
VPQRRCHEPAAPTDIEHLGPGAEHHWEDLGVAGQSAHRRGAQLAADREPGRTDRGAQGLVRHRDDQSRADAVAVGKQIGARQ